MYDRILLATDGTTASAEAEAHALDLADYGGSRLYVLSVVDESVYSVYTGDEYVHEREGLESALVEEAETAVDRVADEARGRDIDVVPIVVRGNPVDEILTVIEQHDPQVTLLGSSDMRDDASRLIGRVAERVAHQTDKPVMIIKTAT